MLINATIEKLQALSLGGMARALTEQLERPEYAELSFEERLGLLVDREATDRENRRLARQLKAARLRSDAVIEDLDLKAPRGLDRATVLGLAEGHWVAAHPGGSGDEDVAVGIDPVALGERQHGRAVEPSRRPQVEVLDDRIAAQPSGLQLAGEAAVLAVGGLAVDEQAEPLLEGEPGVGGGLELLGEGTGHAAQAQGLELLDRRVDEHRLLRSHS